MVCAIFQVNQVNRDSVEGNELANLLGKAFVNVVYVQRRAYNSANLGQCRVLISQATGGLLAVAERSLNAAALDGVFDGAR